jgi:hypothetical protein
VRAPPRRSPLSPSRRRNSPSWPWRHDFEALGREIGSLVRQAGGVAARSRQRPDRAAAERITRGRKDDWDDRCRLLGRDRCFGHQRWRLFHKFGARKLADYVKREIDRSLANRSVPVALPGRDRSRRPNAQQGGGVGDGLQRPVAGPVVTLTATSVSAEELLGGSQAPPAPTTDGMATRVLTKGEPVTGPSGRADDFSWPRGGPDSADPAAAEPARATKAAPPRRAR